MLKILLSLKNNQKEILNILNKHKVDLIDDDKDLISLVEKGNYNLVIIEGDINLIPSIKASDPRVEIILFGEKPDTAIDAVSRGASAYLTFPPEEERLKELIEDIDDLFQARKESAELEKRLNGKYTFFSEIVGRNPKMLDIFAFIQHIAPHYKTVTITGETGTGKEILARALHNLGPGAEKPFIVCNCGGLVETLVESELFGHKKGAFTGAVNDKIGLFEAAGEGTIFLDEIAELPLSIQPRLLRVLQNGEFRPIGSSQTLKAKCRVIAATNKDLSDEVKNRRFREDLFYRLTPLTISIPPLRERKDDLPLLCRFFLEKLNKKIGKNILGLSRPVQSVLLSYDWPGNVRELENVIEQASIVATESFIRLNDLPPYLREIKEKKRSDILTLEEVIKSHIEAVLKRCDGNKSRAAKILGISRRALFRKIEKYL
ncbi:MAG: sigma-54 interaction domain-containing protein [Thermodesulfovibrionales bacterium]